jgi:spermidine/putrescine transport system permease protein
VTLKKSDRRLLFSSWKNFYIALVFLFLFLPVFVVIVFSFNTSKINILLEGFTTEWYAAFPRNRPLMEAFWNTLAVALVSTAVSTVIGTLGGIGMVKYDFPGKKLIDQLLYIPVVIPEIVLGIALLASFTFVHMPLGLGAITLSHVTFCIPFVLINVRARFVGFETAQEEASMDLGANRFQTFLRIILPQIMPGVISGAMLSFSLSLDDVVISFFVTGPGSTTLPLKILSMVKTGVTPEVNALSTVIMSALILLIASNTAFQLLRMKKLKTHPR